MTIARVSQLPTEALSGPAATGSPVRVVQSVAETVSGDPASGTPVRTVALTVEGMATIASPVRMAQIVVEGIYIDPPPIAISQLAVETTYSPSPPVQMAHYVIEAILTHPAPALPDNLVFAFEPNWGDRYTERMEFLTWQAQSYGGQGQRAALRRVPRLTLEYSTSLAGTDSILLDMLLASGQSATYLLPRWHLGDALGAPLASGSTSIPTATDGREFAAGSYALIRVDSTTHELVRIVSIFANSLTLDAPTVSTWPATARVYPVARAILQDSQRVTRWSAEATLTTVQFRLLGVAIPPSYTPPHALDGDPVWLSEPIFADNAKINYRRQQISVDYGFVDPAITDAPARPFMQRSGRHVLGSKTEIAQWRGFLTDGHGRRRRFWRPVYTAGLTPAVAIAATDTTLTVAAVGYSLFPNALAGRMALAIRDSAGAWTFARVNAITPSSGQDSITLTEAIGVNLTVAQVAAMYFMELVTHDGDAIEMTWFTADVAETVLATVGVDT